MRVRHGTRSHVCQEASFRLWMGQTLVHHLVLNGTTVRPSNLDTYVLSHKKEDINWLAISSFNFDLSFSLIISPLSYENLFLEFACAIKFKVDLVLVVFLLNVKCFLFKERTLLSKNRMVDGFLIYIVECEMKKLCSLVSLTCYTQRWIW